MTRERAIEVLKAWDLNWSDSFTSNEFEQAFAMAISALSADGEYIRKSELLGKTVRRNSIWNEVTNSEGKGLEEIVNDLSTYSFPEELSEDGTLTVHVSDGSKVNRVFVMGDNIFGGLYYPDSAENMGEWIPIEERKPAEDGEYLLWGKISEDEESDYQFIGNYDTCGEEFGDWEDYYDSSTLGFLDSELHKYYEVLAWQPLPEPYKKGESK